MKSLLAALNTFARVILVAALACGSGCARPDWIQQTLVTVDVTGTWRTTEGGRFELDLEQEGSKVKGSMRLAGLPGVSNLSGPIDGTVSGDTFSFKGPSTTGEMTVNGDEMIGAVRGIGTAAAGTSSRIPFTLRRVNSSPPRSQ